jgi:redox-sensitive bicupin YhaK (pirin superfamily)
MSNRIKCILLFLVMAPQVDPYLMLDELKLPAKQAFAGFPDHPHRGFETCSIMLSGKMEHQDSAGNKVRERVFRV